ncbi:MAG: flagellar biosynthetic protein FliQ [Candidatus Dadabacteria bacterium]|nr:MAG: flagellar biosynthetic protein FliQ [Candidatus Dadabacteria bacterium]
MFDIYIKETFLMVIIFSALPLAVSSLAGLMVSILQAATQVQEQSIVFFAKFAAIVVALAFASDWICRELSVFFGEVVGSVALLGKIQW